MKSIRNNISAKKLLKRTGFLLLAFLVSLGLAAQDNTIYTVTGTITDEYDEPLEDVLVGKYEQNVVVYSDKNGYFTIHATKEEVLTFTKDGFLDKTIVADPSKEMIVIMEVTKKGDNDYINTVYGKVKKQNSLAATSVIKGTTMEQYPVASLENTLMGNASGIYTYEKESEPGWSYPDVFLRGIRTFNFTSGVGNFGGSTPYKNSQPYVIIDGVPRDMTYLDAYSIEDVTIIKDHSLGALYGMRGANGLIVINTKRGEAGKTKINFNQEFGWQQPVFKKKYQNSADFARALNRAYELDGYGEYYAFTQSQIDGYQKTVDGAPDADPMRYPNTDWFDVITREYSPQNRTNFSISGGNNRTRYFVGFTYMHQEFMYDKKWTHLKKDEGWDTQHKSDRFNVRSNIDIDLTSTTFFSLDLGGRYEVVQGPYENRWGIFTWANESHPTLPVLNPNGTFAQSKNHQANPAAFISSTGFDRNKRRSLYTNVRLNQKLDVITEGLSVSGLVGFDSYNVLQILQNQWYDSFYWNPEAENEEDAYERTTTGTPLSDPRTVAREMAYNVNLNLSVDYKRTFVEDHNVAGMAMIRSYKNTIPGYTSAYRYLSYLGQANYDYKNKYLFQAVGTYMGSDNYARGSRYGFFPSFAGGWVISEEDFAQKDWLDLVKVRVSWGKTGNDMTIARRYLYQDVYAEGGGYAFGVAQSHYQGAYESEAGNPNAKWEVSKMTNAGFDLEFLLSRLYMSFDVFFEKRSDILCARATIPDMYGIASPLDSYGKVSNKGGEITIGYRDIIKDFRFGVEFTGSFVRNKIEEMDEVSPMYDYQARTGQPIGKPFGLLYEKFFDSYEEIAASVPQYGELKPGNIKWRDYNKDGIVDDFDMVPLSGSKGYPVLHAADDYQVSIPEIMTGLKLKAGYKGFEVSALFTGQFHRTVNIQQAVVHSFYWFGKSTPEVLKSWGYYSEDPTDPRNINAVYPRLTTVENSNDVYRREYSSDFWRKNGDNINLRNLEVSYTLPHKLIAPAGLTNLRFYVSGYNLKTWDKLDGLTEVENPRGFSWQSPKTRTYSIGVNIGF